MSDQRRNGDPPELIYMPRPSWYPALLALGLAGVITSVFTWWPYGVLGAIIALAALFGWIRESRESFNKLPRNQRVATAVIPAVPLRSKR